MARDQIEAIKRARPAVEEAEYRARTFQVADPRTDGTAPSRTTTETRGQAAVRVTMTLEANEAREDARARRQLDLRNEREAGLEQVAGVAAYRNNMNGLRPDQRAQAVETSPESGGSRAR